MLIGTGMTRRWWYIYGILDSFQLLVDRLPLDHRV